VLVSLGYFSILSKLTFALNNWRKTMLLAALDCRFWLVYLSGVNTTILLCLFGAVAILSWEDETYAGKPELKNLSAYNFVVAND